MRASPRLEQANIDDAAAIAVLRNAAADRLTKDYGEGYWSALTSEKSVLYAMRLSRVFVMRQRWRIVATLRLATKKPWAIDTSYFTTAKRPIYLTDMAVDPRMQRQGIGRRCLIAAADIVRAWPGDAIRLDAYDAEAGAGAFYQKCGYCEVGRVTYRGTPLVYYELLV
ncbi:MAG: GNAT family N-acetyltransferase [Gemmatimonadota bacterium]